MNAIVVYESLVGQYRRGGPGGGRGPRPGRPGAARRRGRGRRRRRRGAHRRRRPGVRLQALVAADARRHPQEPGQGAGAGPLLPAAVRVAGGAARRARAGGPRSTPRSAAPSARARRRSPACSRPRATPRSPSRRASSSRAVTARSRAVRSSGRARGAPSSRAPSSGGAAPDELAAARRARAHHCRLTYPRFHQADALRRQSGLVPCVTRAFTLEYAASVAGGSRGPASLAEGPADGTSPGAAYCGPPSSGPLRSERRPSIPSPTATRHCQATEEVRATTTSCQPSPSKRSHGEKDLHPARGRLDRHASAACPGVRDTRQ